jgi:hypothetical protein
VWAPHHCEWSCDGVVEKGCGFSISLFHPFAMAFESLTLPPNPLSNAFSTQVFFGDWERYLVLERRRD